MIHRASDPNVSLKVRLILDGGSQKSYVSKRVCDILDLEVVGEQPLSIATFGSDKGCSRVCPIVTVGLCLRSYPLSLYVMPTICEPLVGQPILACINQHPHLMGLELADSSGNKSPLLVDVLIGCPASSVWELEALRIQDKERTLYDNFTGAVKFEDGRYKVSLPWKEFYQITTS